ncbi:ABC transporter permease [Lentzea alba]|uniref:ABC transporter permease n=1 Tax=Lentzea alba TaxID=2714351 RepID=UPI0039BEE55D
MLVDTWLIFRREIVLRFRDPMWVAIDIAHPLLYVFLFGPLMKQFVLHTPGFPPGSMWMIFTPALLMQVAITAGSFVGMSLLADYRAGVVERFRVTPSSAVSQLLGKVLAVAMNVLLLAVIVFLAVIGIFGTRPSVVGAVVCFGIVFLFAIAIASSSYSVALRLKNERTVSTLINAVMLPLLLLSGTLVPITEVLAPGWLYSLSRLNPVSYGMDAARAAFRGDLSVESIGPGVAVLAALCVLTLWWGVRSFSKEDA